MHRQRRLGRSSWSTWVFHLKAFPHGYLDQMVIGLNPSYSWSLMSSLGPHSLIGLFGEWFGLRLCAWKPWTSQKDPKSIAKPMGNIPANLEEAEKPHDLLWLLLEFHETLSDWGFELPTFKNQVPAQAEQRSSSIKCSFRSSDTHGGHVKMAHFPLECCHSFLWKSYDQTHLDTYEAGMRNGCWRVSRYTQAGKSGNWASQPWVCSRYLKH